MALIARRGKLPRQFGRDAEKREKLPPAAVVDSGHESMLAANSSPMQPASETVQPQNESLAPRPALYLVATPIGNLEDITLRALRILKEADVIACEDTRQTQKLLNHYGITTRTVSYHEHNEMTRAAELVKDLQEGTSVALVTDAGMPGISDPGFRLISLAIRHHLPVVPIPGVSAFLAALVASGLPTDSFRFSGFLPAKRGERRGRAGSRQDFAAHPGFLRSSAPHRRSAGGCGRSPGN